MEIRCRKGDCIHNTGASCMARDVLVDRRSKCSSYNSDPLKKNLIIQNGNLFEISEELVTKNLRDVPLNCRARICIYNNGGDCRANGIFVIEGDDDAPCATFIER